jgi:hypothetical protein
MCIAGESAGDCNDTGITTSTTQVVHHIALGLLAITCFAFIIPDVAAIAIAVVWEAPKPGLKAYVIII